MTCVLIRFNIENITDNTRTPNGRVCFILVMRIAHIENAGLSNQTTLFLESLNLYFRNSQKIHKVRMFMGCRFTIYLLFMDFILGYT